MQLPYKNKYLLAPMEGVNDVAFRQLCEEKGAGFTYTQQLSPLAILHENEKTKNLLRTAPGENVGLQLFGRNADTILKAWDLVHKPFKLLDLNLGCPSKKIVAQGYGSALLQEKQVVKKLVKDIAGSIEKPFTVKMRSGFKNEEAVAIAKMIEDGGAKAIAIHGRTQEQKYSGNADWNLIRKVHQTLSIPIIGNGDITKPEQAHEYINKDYCSHVMIGRGAMSNPSIFRQCINFEKDSTYEKSTKETQFKMMQRYHEIWKERELPESLLRSHLTWMAHGFSGAAALRSLLNTSKPVPELTAFLRTDVVLE
ncbi:MAG: tRNA-dihydrouridine synthase family protein [Candidatus Woesearchaeota archaeon]